MMRSHDASLRKRGWAAARGGVVCTAWLRMAALAQAPAAAFSMIRPSSTHGERGRALSLALTAAVPVKELTPEVRERVQTVLDKPTLTTRGPVEIFRGRHAL